MDNSYIFFMIVMAIVIAVVSSSWRKANKHNYDTTNGGDYSYNSSDDTYHCHHHGHTDHDSGYCSSGDSSSSDSGGSDCGGGGCD